MIGTAKADAEQRRRNRIQFRLEKDGREGAV